MNSNGTSYQNGLFVNVDEEHNNTKNMTLSGFNQVGGKVTGNIENLTIESKQNTSTTTGSTKGGSIGFAPNGMPTSISANYSQTNGERKYVDDPTTFIIGEGSNLKVGKVENTAVAIGTSGNGKLSIDEYVGHNLENKDKTTTKGGSVSLSQSSIPISGVGVNYANRDLELVTKNTVVGNVEIGKSSGDEINKDLDAMTEVTKDEDTKTNVFVESQTIRYVVNPESFKEDLQKAKNEIHDIYHAVDSTVNPQGKESRNILQQLGEVRQAKTILNVVGSRLEIAENQEDIAKAFEGVSEDLGYKVKVIYTNPSNSPQLIGIDKDRNVMYTLSPLPEDMKKQRIPPIPLPEEEKNPRIPPMDPPKEETEKEKREREERARREEQEFFNELQKPNGIPSQQERPVTVYYTEKTKKERGKVKTKAEILEEIRKADQELDKQEGVEKKIGENAKGRRIYKTKEGYTIYADDFHSKVEYEVFNRKGKYIGTIPAETIIKNGFYKEDIDTSKKDPKKRIDQ